MFSKTRETEFSIYDLTTPNKPTSPSQNNRMPSRRRKKLRKCLSVINFRTEPLLIDIPENKEKEDINSYIHEVNISSAKSADYNREFDHDFTWFADQL